MAIIPRFKLKVFGGKFEFDDPEKVSKYMGTLSGEYEMTIRKPQKPRSNQQNRYAHGVIFKMIAQEIGLSDIEAKEMMRLMFLTYENKGYLILRSTTDLSTVEMEEFNENCRRWAASELKLNIPTPNEVDFSSFDEYEANTQAD